MDRNGRQATSRSLGRMREEESGVTCMRDALRGVDWHSSARETDTSTVERVSTCAFSGWKQKPLKQTDSDSSGAVDMTARSSRGSRARTTQTAAWLPRCSLRACAHRDPTHEKMYSVSAWLSIERGGMIATSNRTYQEGAESERIHDLIALHTHSMTDALVRRRSHTQAQAIGTAGRRTM